MPSCVKRSERSGASCKTNCPRQWTATLSARSCLGGDVSRPRAASWPAHEMMMATHRFDLRVAMSLGLRGTVTHKRSINRRHSPFPMSSRRLTPTGLNLRGQALWNLTAPAAAPPRSQSPTLAGSEGSSGEGGDVIIPSRSGSSTGGAGGSSSARRQRVGIEWDLPAAIGQTEARVSAWPRVEWWQMSLVSGPL